MIRAGDGFVDGRDYREEPREDQPGDTPPACSGCRKSAHCPTFLPAVVAYLDTPRDWRDHDGDPVACLAAEDEGAIGKRLRVLGYQLAGVKVPEERSAIVREMMKLRCERALRRQSSRRTSKGKGRDGRGRFVVTS